MLEADGGRYEGDWKDDKWHGRGVLVSADGSKYEGDLKDGNLHGRGVLVFANGNRYEGDWSHCLYRRVLAVC